MSNVTVTFGEIMMRLAYPTLERFLQSPQFVATFGGGEANVSVALALFGLHSAYITVLPERNPIADAAIADLRRLGVDTSTIVRGKGRMGTYYMRPAPISGPQKSFTTASTLQLRLPSAATSTGARLSNGQAGFT